VNVTLSGKQIFADVIKLNISRRDDLRFPGWALKNLVMAVPIRGRRREDAE